MEKSNKQLLEDLGVDLKKINGDGKTLCPKCSHTRKKKNDPCLSVDVVNGKYNCWNDSCDFHGKVGGTTYSAPAKDYVRPPFVNNTEMRDKTVKWFFGERSISPKTLIDCKVTENVVWMPQTQENMYAINFNYFREGELVNVKYRAKNKSFKLVKNAELVFYGLDDIKDSNWCVIVEGEIDKLSWWEAGVKEVVSVPNGASKSSNVNLEYLDNCIDYFENKTKVIIATDDDDAGHALRDELVRRLGSDRCYRVDLQGFKDSNEFLHARGDKALSAIIEDKNLIEFPIDGIITASMIWDDLNILFAEGLKRGDITGSLPDFDNLVSFVPGQFMVMTGIPNHGKSPFALMVMACLSKNCGWKWGLFTPEHKPLKIYLAKICELLLGKRMREGIGFTDREKELAKEFIDTHFIFIQPEDDDCTLDNILEKAKSLVVRKGIKGLLIDPWNKLEHNIAKGENETTYVSKEIDKLIRFNQKHSVFSIVIAHPTKIRKQKDSGLFEVPNLYDISGSSNWFNKPDIGITIYRNYETKQTEVYVQKMKYEHLGEQGHCFLRFNLNNSRFTHQYGDYDNLNWLIPKEEQQDMFNPKIKSISRVGVDPVIPDRNDDEDQAPPF